MQGVKVVSSPRRQYSTTSAQVSSSTKVNPSTTKPVSKGATLNQTLGQTFAQKVEQYEHRDFLRVPFENVRWTFVETKRKSDIYAEGFGAQHWDKKGNRMAFALPTGAESAVLQICTARIGTVFTLFKPDPSANELCALMDHVKPLGMIWRPNTIHNALWKDMKKIVPEFEYYPRDYRPGPWWCDRFPGLRYVIQADARPIIEAEFLTLSDLRVANKITPSCIPKIAATLKPDDTIGIYTKLHDSSKVTARSYSHNDYLATANHVGDILGLEPGDRVCLSYPLHEELGHAVGIWSCLTHGAFVVIPSDTFNPELHLKAIPQEFCNTLIASPAYADAIFNNPNVHKFDLSKLKKVLIVSEQPVAPELVQKLKEFKLDVITLNPREKAKGRDLPPIQL